MNNFWQRALTGTVFVGVIVGAVMLGKYSFLALLVTISVGGMYEFYKITLTKVSGIAWVFIVFGCLIILFGEIVNIPFAFRFLSILFLLSVIFSIGAISTLFSKDRSWKQIVYLMGGLLYVALPLSLFYVSSFNVYNEYHSLLPLNIFILIWCSDTFAYISGRAFGKNKLFPEVSPGKTWEGFYGGVIFSVGFSFILAHFWNIPYVVNFSIALCTVVFGTLGDLVESMLKREFGIKDSGNTLPGHGGVLDRFDALLISLPFTSACMMIYQILNGLSFRF